MFQEILDDRLEEPSPSSSLVKSPAKNGTCQVDKVSIGGLDDYRYVKIQVPDCGEIRRKILSRFNHEKSQADKLNSALKDLEEELEKKKTENYNLQRFAHSVLWSIGLENLKFPLDASSPLSLDKLIAF